ncbi:MAG: endonuclease/exonuclease/phosphatase family protein [Rhodobacteraceae bacterium]|nr:endonuclease/exonuclease/phosphatase family protein [Paracoccaceae bacterium]
MATWNAELTRPGPGLLLRDIEGGRDAQVAAAVAVIAAAAPDVLLLTGIDYDHGLEALDALAGLLAAAGQDYPHRFALRPNTGRASGLDLDGDGRAGGPGDAQGFGRFAGQGGMALLSKLPLAAAEARDFSAFVWRDLPGALLPRRADGDPFPSEAAAAVQRLSTTGHWAVPVVLPGGGRLTLLAWHATPPVFDGPEDRNGRRNHDEAAFWLRLIEGDLPGAAPPAPPFVLIGDANLDTADGEGRPEALAALLGHPMLTDPAPASAGGAAAAAEQGGANLRHRGPPALDTADWPDDPGPGNLRVDYVLPSRDLAVLGAGVLWPEPADPLAAAVAAASRHRLVWVDLALP